MEISEKRKECMHLNSRLLFEKYAKQFFKPQMKILEIGPDTVPSTFQRALGDSTLTWHTLDMRDRPDMTYANSREYNFPIHDEAYDIVFSCNVIEHVRMPWKWIPELARVAKVGGFVITLGPVSWSYHESPVDCWRIYPDGMKALYEDASLVVIRTLWESLETPHYRRYTAGNSFGSQGVKEKFNRILGFFGYPVERSYDTLTIGKKVENSGFLGNGKASGS